MSGKKLEIIPPPPPKPVSPPNSAPGITEVSRVAGTRLAFDAASIVHSCPALAPRVANGSGGHPPPPPPHSPPPPNPKSAQLHDRIMIFDELTSKPGYPPPPPPHSPPPPPPPKSQSGYSVVVAPSFSYGVRIYPMNEVPPDGNTPKPPRPHPDLVSPSPPPPRADLNRALQMFVATVLFWATGFQPASSLLTFRGGLCRGMVVGRA